MLSVHALLEEDHAITYIAALSFAIDDYNRKLPTPSCTSVPSKWNIPKNIKEPKDIPIPNFNTLLRSHHISNLRILGYHHHIYLFPTIISSNHTMHHETTSRLITA